MQTTRHDKKKNTTPPLPVEWGGVGTKRATEKGTNKQNTDMYTKRERGP